MSDKLFKHLVLKLPWMIASHVVVAATDSSRELRQSEIAFLGQVRREFEALA